MKKQLLFILSYLLFGTSVFCQTPITITGRTFVQDNQVIPTVKVNFYSPCFENFLGTMSSDSGQYSITLPYCTAYHIQCIAEGFDTLNTEFKTGSDSTYSVPLKLNIKKMSVIDITSNQNAVSVKGDKIIVDAEKISPGATANALDLLMRCPGVVVNEESNSISLQGRNGVMIMVNDRLQQLFGEDLFNWLRNQPAETIEKIELISNPSARYDAAGNAGLINFRMKRNKQKGISGTLSSGAGQGRYAKLSEGANINYAKKGMSWTNSYNYALRKGFNQLYLQRNFFNQDTFIGAYQQRNYLRLPVNTHTFRSGLDYNLSNTTAMGISASGNATAFNPNGKNYSNVYGPDGNLSSYFSTINDSKDFRYNGSSNAYLKKNLDTLGSIFTIDLDAATFSNRSDQLFTTEYFDLNYNKSLPDYLLAGDQQSKLQIWAVKSDWVKQYKSGRQMEMGVKASHVVADNDLKFFNRSQGLNLVDSSKSNHFIYTENILAGYIQGAGKIKTVAIQGGLRFEQTIANGKQTVNNENFNKIYGQLFPSLTLQKVTSKGNIKGISVSRRIDRPDYSDLNPFKFYLDPTTYKAGNPALNPQFTWVGQLQYNRAKGSAFTLGFNRSTQMITEVIYPSENDPKITIQTNKNLQNFSSLIFTAASPVALGKKSKGYWTSILGYQYFSGNVANSPLGKGSFVAILQGSQNYSINRFWTADLNASLQSGQVYAYMRLKALGQLGFGLQRSIWEKTGTIKLSVTDVLFTGNPSANNEFTGYTEEFEVKRETRVAMLSLSWRFGTPQGQPKRRQGGAEEEKQRAQGNIG